MRDETYKLTGVQPANASARPGRARLNQSSLQVYYYIESKETTMFIILEDILCLGYSPKP